MTVFCRTDNARTVDFHANDVGFVPSNAGHYIENTDNSTPEGASVGTPIFTGQSPWRSTRFNGRPVVISAHIQRTGYQKGYRRLLNES